MQIAQAEGATELVGRIQFVLDALREAAGESMPPALNLIFRLVDADYPQETRALLEENRSLVDDTFLALLDAFIGDVEKSDSYDPKTRDELLRHLRNVATQARLLA